MMAEEIVRLLNGRGHYPRWRARCPVHKSRGLTLALHAGEDRLSITCHAGCSSDDVMAAVGLTWKAMLYNDSTLSPAEKRKWARRKYINDLYAKEQRMQALKEMIEVVER